MLSRHLQFIVLSLLALTLCSAAELKKETVAAWNDYIAKENLTAKARANQQEQFLWVDGSAERSQQVKTGKILVAPFSNPNPLRVPNGLIHHWIGAAFITNAKIDDVLAITRDYKHYKDYYKPGVADASLTSTTPAQDKFTIRFVNQSILSNTSLVGTYLSNFIRLDGKRFYSISETTGMREVVNFGGSNEKPYPPDQGSGYLWRIYSQGRMEERDGGVLLEIEAIVLSRDIPFGLRWFVYPIVRRVSRESLEKSLSETGEAVHQRLKACEAKSQRIESGTCSQYANNSSLRAEKLASHEGR